MEAKYANIIGFRVSPNEVAIEFGSFFPPGSEDNRIKPDYRDFHTRIVLSPELIEALKMGLDQAIVAREQVRKARQGQPRFNFDTTEVKSA
jgi:hypothetical protein